MFQRSAPSLINYMRLHGGKAARQYSAEYGKTWTKEITPRTQQDIQLYGWYHNYPYHNQNDLTWWADRKRPRFTVAAYGLRDGPCSIFSSLLKKHASSVVHQLSIGGKKTLLLPTDKAFTDPSFVSALLNDSSRSHQFLMNHAIAGELSVRTLAQRCRQSRSGTVTVKALGGKSITVRVTGSLETGNREVLFGNGRVEHHGMKCSNGVVFVLDSLI